MLPKSGVRFDVEWRLPVRSKRKKMFRTEREARQFETKVVVGHAVGNINDPRAQNNSAKRSIRVGAGDKTSIRGTRYALQRSN